MHRAVVGRQRVDAAELWMRQHGGWRTVDTDMPGDREDLKIHGSNRSAFLVCDESIT